MFPMKIARFLQRGLLRYLILKLINEGPRHGYEIMRHFQDEFNGLYQPSPGAIYPILQAFEERGYVNGEEIEGKKVYSITPKGKEVLAAREARFQQRIERMEAFMSKRRGLHKEIRQLAGLLMTSFPDLTDEQSTEIETILKDTRRKISEVLFA
jgi:DNA-binding PadR family transcriptional regulator